MKVKTSKKLPTFLCASALAFSALIGAARAATVTVTNIDGTVSVGAPGTFYWALTNCNAGDTIAFDIPGPGPHYLQSPADGWPLIYRKHNILIDGYSQPGASPNTNPITGTNNAVIKIVLDARGGGTCNMAYETYGTTVTTVPPIDNSTMATERSGFGSDERAILGIYRSTNGTIRGVATLGTATPLAGGNIKGFCFAHDYDLDPTVQGFFGYGSGKSDYWHINGCWFGVDPTNQTVAGVTANRAQMAIAMYRHRDVSGGPRPELGNVGMVIGVKPGSADPRSQFNIFCGFGYAIDGENCRTVVAGNSFGVMPDGKTPYNIILEQGIGLFGGGHFEFGRYNDTMPIVIGTDGDGVNDADEGNVFGPLGPADGGPTGASAESILDFYSLSRKPYIIAGNRIGVAGDGTPFTNNCIRILGGDPAGGTQIRFGSDFNGVSDALEANIVYNNNGFAGLFPVPASSRGPSMFQLGNPTASAMPADAWISVRGNVMVNNFAIANPDDVNSAGRYLNYWTNFVANPAAAVDTVPVLSGSSTLSTLIGTSGAPNGSYTNLVIDVYLPDPDGQVNGALFDYPFFGGTAGWGFVQGKTYLGSYLDNGPLDSNPALGAFSLDISGLGLTSGTKVTVAVTYSSFVRPNITSISHSSGVTTLTWTGDNGGPYTVVGQGGASSGFGVQSASSIGGPWATTFAAGNSASLAAGSSAGFYRIIGPRSGMTTLCAIPVTLP